MANGKGYSAGDLQVSITGIDASAISSIDAVIARLRNLQTAINTLDTTKLSEISAALSGVGGKKTSSGNGKLNKKINYVNNKSGKSGGGFGFLDISKWLGVLFVARRLGNVVGGIVQHGADYTETLNLWETAMGDNVGMANEFVKKMNEAYGISEKTLMNAQAIFKNMLGSLGQISESTAYALSEGITQMAVDYASLYNVTFEKAFEKFQSALAGQVRPIRSVSGYDITENTIYQLYQELGGEKSVRNLSRTEKQLLGILAIFRQMSASGAVGDLYKTIPSFANQSRVLAESWQQVMTYSGTIITHLIQQSGLLTHINAILIFVGDLLKAVAESMGAIYHFGGDIFGGTADSAKDASKEIDKLNGKLLGFDKFRAMNTSEDEDVAIDEVLSNAIAGYSTILENASMGARELAKTFKEMSGLFNKDGSLNVEKWEELLDTIETFVHLLQAIITQKLITGIIGGLQGIGNASIDLTNTLMTGIIWAILQAIDAFKDGDITMGIIATTIGVVLVSALVAFKIAQAKAGASVEAFAVSMKKSDTAMLENAKNLSQSASVFRIVSVALTAMVASFSIMDGIFGSMDEQTRNLASSWSILVGILATALGVILAIKGGAQWGLAGAIVAGLGVGAVLAGIKAQAQEGAQFKLFAEGGLPDKGTMFVAGEAGAEMVYNMPSGQSGVANIQQISQAQESALNRWWARAKSDIPQFREVSKTGIYEVAKSEMKRRGEW